ncbi:DUF6153 family protein [Nocardia sp. NPDC056611]|uniref:DUF6153 family protein n=1 Tax=Nocardia sp. NPDC056611 TaxID=3345877 RepID=UPI00366E6BF4
MVEQRSPGTRFIRAFGLLALLAGLVAMHALVFGMSHDGMSHDSDPAMSAPAAMADWHDKPISLPEAAPITVLTDMDQSMSVPGCGGDCGDGHAGMHGCLFVLTVLLLGLGPALLAWVGPGRRDTLVSTPRHPRGFPARPPPWTVLSLADLAILRI